MILSTLHACTGKGVCAEPSYLVPWLARSTRPRLEALGFFYSLASPTLQETWNGNAIAPWRALHGTHHGVALSYAILHDNDNDSIVFFPAPPSGSSVRSLAKIASAHQSPLEPILKTNV